MDFLKMVLDSNLSRLVKRVNSLSIQIQGLAESDVSHDNSTYFECFQSRFRVNINTGLNQAGSFVSTSARSASIRS